MPKHDNSHLCEFCNGDGLDAGQEMCKPCQATGIQKQYWAMEILKLQEKVYKLKETILEIQAIAK